MDQEGRNGRHLDLTVLHVGAGHQKLQPAFAAYRETRLDTDPSVSPDICASIVSVPMLQDDSFDAVYCAHILEHLFFHEVRMALKECFRVLKKTHQAIVIVPDLEQVAQALSGDRLEQPLYQSDAGPICAIDILFGHRASVALGNHHMQHKTGFTRKTLAHHLENAGFQDVETNRDTQFNLWGLGKKP